VGYVQRPEQPWKHRSLCDGGGGRARNDGKQALRRLGGRIARAEGSWVKERVHWLGGVDVGGVAAPGALLPSDWCSLTARSCWAANT
jgi:hypothetical protein